MRFLLAAALLASSVAATATPQIKAPTEPVLSGDEIPILIEGLRPGTEVTLASERLSNAGQHIGASATYRADRNGRVDIARAAPVRGSYQGVDAVGLFWSMAKLDAPPPPSLTAGQVHLTARADGKDIAAADLTIRIARPDLTTVDVPGLAGSFIMAPPPDGTRRPAIIFLGGSEGGDSTARGAAARFASRGYVVLGYPYFSPPHAARQIEGLPTAFVDLPVDRLQAAYEALAARPDVDAGRIALWGGSKGAEFALIAATRFDWVKAVAAIVPTDVVWEGWGREAPPGTLAGFTWRGRPLPFVPRDSALAAANQKATASRFNGSESHRRGRERHPDAVAAAAIPVERFPGALLLAGGGADQVWPSGEMARIVAEKRRRANLPTELLVYPDAGHALTGDGYNSMMDNANMGGTPAANARAQRDVWLRTLAFFKRTLGGPER